MKKTAIQNFILLLVFFSVGINSMRAFSFQDFAQQSESPQQKSNDAAPQGDIQNANTKAESTIPAKAESSPNPNTNQVTAPKLMEGIDLDKPRPVDVGASAQNAPMESELNRATEESVRRGLRYLASLQNDDGSFGRGRFARHAGITSLCALAFMSDGHLPGRGVYGDNVRKALEFVLSSATETGLLASENNHGPMYGHGFSTLFLGEIYGMNPEDARVRDALTRAVELIKTKRVAGDTTPFHTTLTLA